MPPVIAIDGPSASGKSSTAAAVARAIGAVHLDSGALYRGLTVLALDLADRSVPAIIRAADQRGLELRRVAGDLVPFLDGRDAEPRIRTPEVTALVSEVSAQAPLREWVNARLRSAVQGAQPVVMDGRDIGTAVFPDARLKVFLTASPEARARRRLIQRGEAPDPARLEAEAARLAERDHLDSTRAIAPLRRAADAVLLDTSDMSFERQVGAIVRLIRTTLQLP
ncbi:MAG TPA: (d)CMP kinase [Gemmatimonadales bacterium]|nr:(d)CMP kinase [Gemmatimonadales bacterium]